jgi:transcription elongation factor Elf1
VRSCDIYTDTSPDLTQPVDVYADWIDACEAVEKKNEAPSTLPPPSYRQRQASASARAGLAPGEKYTEEDAGFIDDDDVDAEAEYADE